MNQVAADPVCRHTSFFHGYKSVIRSKSVPKRDFFVSDNAGYHIKIYEFVLYQFSYLNYDTINL
jgi:hypothetical protein